MHSSRIVGCLLIGAALTVSCKSEQRPVFVENPLYQSDGWRIGVPPGFFPHEENWPILQARYPQMKELIPLMARLKGNDAGPSDWRGSFFRFPSFIGLQLSRIERDGICLSFLPGQARVADAGRISLASEQLGARTWARTGGVRDDGSRWIDFNACEGDQLWIAGLSIPAKSSSEAPMIERDLRAALAEAELR